jgi:hypothetical protein
MEQPLQDPLIAALDNARPPCARQAWEPLLPASALAHVLEMLVLPKLRLAVGEWEPRQDTVPIHAWVFPWLPYLGAVRAGARGLTRTHARAQRHVHGVAGCRR